MATKTKTKIIEIDICDCCGEEIPDDVGNPSVVAYTAKREVAFESRFAGRYCEECGDALLYETLGSIFVPDRYDGVENGQLERELEMIKKRREDDAKW